MTEAHKHTSEDWQRLAKAIVDRRFDRDLSQEDLVKRGGPSHQTVRNVERGQAADYRPTTFRKFDRALSWHDGTTQKILDGTVTEDELNASVVRLGTAEERDEARPVTSGANLGALTASTGRRGFTPKRTSGSMTVGQILDAAGYESPVGEISRRLAELRDPLVESGVAAAMQQLASISQPFLDDYDHTLGQIARGLAIDLLPQVGVAASVLQQAGAASAAAAAFGILQDHHQSPWQSAALEFVRVSQNSMPVVEVTDFLGLEGKLRALAIPSVSPEIRALWVEFEKLEDKIVAEPWFDEDMQITEAVRRYKREHPDEDDEASVHHERTVTDSAVGTDSVATSATDQAPKPADEAPVADVIHGPWSTVFVAQQEVGDVQDLALASELFARVSRRPSSEERTLQLRALNGLIGEFINDRDNGAQDGDSLPQSLHWSKDGAPSNRARRSRPAPA